MALLFARSVFVAQQSVRKEIHRGIENGSARVNLFRKGVKIVGATRRGAASRAARRDRKRVTDVASRIVHGSCYYTAHAQSGRLHKSPEKLKRTLEHRVRWSVANRNCVATRKKNNLRRPGVASPYFPTPGGVLLSLVIGSRLPQPCYWRNFEQYVATNIETRPLGVESKIFVFRRRGKIV